MAAKNQTQQMEIWGIVLICFSLLMWLSLLSYLPGEIPFNKEPVSPCSNWIGPVGLYLAWFFFTALGVAAYEMPLLCVAGGCMALWGRNLEPKRFLLLSGLLLVSGAAFLDLPCVFFADGAFLKEWCLSHQVDRPGGLIGENLNSYLLVQYLGKVGAALVLTGVLASALTLLFQIHPVQCIRDFGPWLINAIEEWQMRRADETKRREIQIKKLERERRELEKQMKKAGVSTTQKQLSQTPTPIINIPAENDDGQPVVKKPLPKALVQSPAADSDGDDLAAKRKPIKKTQREGMSQPSFEDYEFPPIELLKKPEEPTVQISHEDYNERALLLMQTIKEFGVELDETRQPIVTPGSTITRYELFPATGERVENIEKLNKNIARIMKCEKVNILAPVPGKDSVGIEIPNPQRIVIALRELFESGQWKNCRAKIPLALGKDVYGNTIVPDLADMPHLLIAGTTGSGKSACSTSIILSLLYKFSPENLRLIMIDPKVVEMQGYNDLPHLVVPVVTDPKKVLVALRWVINEMEKRYSIMAKVGVRNITSFNARPKEQPKVEELDLPSKLAEHQDEDVTISEEPDEEELVASGVDDIIVPDRMPYIVVIVDELADLMQTAPKDVENAIARIAQKARAAGIHLILITQTPRAQVITGVIKTNIPCRIALQVPSSLDSRVILDDSGAENLLGKGDMLFLPPGVAKLTRIQGAFVTDAETEAVVDFIRKRCPATYDPSISGKIAKSTGDAAEVSDDDKEAVKECLEVICQTKRASTSLMQRRLGLGYTRAARIMDILAGHGIVGPENGAKPREILVDLDNFDVDDFIDRL